MKLETKIELLEKNINYLQAQLNASQRRISELNDLCNQQLETIKRNQSQLSYYKSESI